MFDTSKDVLNLVIALSVALFTFFLCWLMYYFISILRTIKQTLTDVQEKINSLDELLTSLKEKISNSSNYLGLLTKSIISLIELFKNRKEKKTQAKKK